MPITVRQLVAADAAAFRALRLLGLEESPEAFGSSYGSEKDRSVESFARSIADGHITGGFAGDRLVAVAGFYVMAQEKAAHRGAVWGVYVHPEARGQGAADSGARGGHRPCPHPRAATPSLGHHHRSCGAALPEARLCRLRHRAKSPSASMVAIST